MTFASTGFGVAAAGSSPPLRYFESDSPGRTMGSGTLPSTSGFRCSWSVVDAIERRPWERSHEEPAGGAGHGHGRHDPAIATVTVCGRRDHRGRTSAVLLRMPGAGYAARLWGRYCSRQAVRLLRRCRRSRRRVFAGSFVGGVLGCSSVPANLRGLVALTRSTATAAATTTTPATAAIRSGCAFTDVSAISCLPVSLSEEGAKEMG